MGLRFDDLGNGVGRIGPPVGKGKKRVLEDASRFDSEAVLVMRAPHLFTCREYGIRHKQEPAS